MLFANTARGYGCSVHITGVHGPAAVGLFQLPAVESGTVELFPGFHVGPGDQCRLMQTCSQDVFVR